MPNFKITDRRFSFGASEKQEFDSAFKQAIQDKKPDEDNEEIDPKLFHGAKKYNSFLSDLG